MLLKKRTTAFVEALRLVAQRQVDRFGRGKLSRFLEDSGLGVDLYSGAEQQVLNSRMQIRPHHETGLGREERDIRRRTVRQEIDDAGGQHQFVQKRIQCRQRIGTLKTSNVNSLGADETLHDRGIPARDDECGVDVPDNQFFRCRDRWQVQKRADDGVDPGPFSQVKGQSAPPASLGAD